MAASTMARIAGATTTGRITPERAAEVGYAGSALPIRAVRTILSCSLVCAIAYPSPGLARGGRPT